MTADVLILVDQQKAMRHPKWGPRNNPDESRTSPVCWRHGAAAASRHPCEARFDLARLAVPAGQEGNEFLPLTAPLLGEDCQ